MDDTPAFLELSALLTGHYNLVNDPEDKALAMPVADEYRRQLMAVFSARLPPLLEAYKILASATPKPPIDDTLLQKLRTTQEFKDHELVAKQIVNIWYFSQFKAADDPAAPFLDGGGFYPEGLVWPLIKAHPIGFSHQPHGYWTQKPGIDSSGRSTLRRGDTGELVKQIQTKLGVDASGNFDGETEAAVRQFQREHPPLVPDGIVGPRTWAALDI